MSNVFTPQQEKDADVASSSIKRDIERHASAADEMIESIRNELFTPPGAPLQVVDGDDDELGEEIDRLARVQDDICQEVVEVQNVASFVKLFEKKSVNDVTQEERNNLIFFVLVAFWVIVYIKQWVEYKMAGSRI
jgi:hypothetical protein